MARPITFKVLRFALIPYEQMDHLERPLPEPKGVAIEEALPVGEPPKRFNYWNRAHAFVGFSRIDERFLLGRLAKRRETGIGLLGEQDFVEITTEDWLPVWLLVDTSRQYLAVEMHGRFGQLTHMLNVLQAGLSAPVEREYRHEVIVSPVSDPRAFWDVVERSPRIFRARLSFVSPNFLNTPRRFREELEGWKRTFNQTEAAVDLRNDEGELALPEDVLEEPVEYISAGEGDWTLDVEEDGRQRTISSRDSAESIRIEMPRASHPTEGDQDETRGGQHLLARLLEIIQGRE